MEKGVRRVSWEGVEKERSERKEGKKEVEKVIGMAVVITIRHRRYRKKEGEAEEGNGTRRGKRRRMDGWGNRKSA